jgi:glycosyltransferase involved in cell wall biosynthesis
MEVVWKGLSYSHGKEDSYHSGSSFKKSAGSVLVGFVGRLDEQKGIPTLLEAMRLVNKQDQKIQLVLAGEGNLRDSIEEFRRRHGLESAILLAGFQSDVDSFLETVDFVVAPSYWEGFGYTALEAMSHGKAVIATHTSSLPEIVIEGQTGLLVPPRSPEKLAEAIISLSNNTELRDAMGREGAKRAEEVFSLSSMISKTETFFLSLAKKQSTK